MDCFISGSNLQVNYSNLFREIIKMLPPDEKAD